MTVTYPDVKLSRPDGFRETYGVDDGARQVEERHRYQRSKSREVDGLVVAVGYYVVNNWDASTHSKCYECTYTEHTHPLCNTICTRPAMGHDIMWTSDLRNSQPSRYNITTVTKVVYTHTHTHTHHVPLSLTPWLQVK